MTIISMTDPYWWDAHDDLQYELGREPTYEEVLDELNKRFGGEIKMDKKEKSFFEYIFDCVNGYLYFYAAIGIIIVVFSIIECIAQKLF